MTIYNDIKPGFVAERGALAKKPKHGEPCNNCGLCCRAVLCDLGQHVFHQVLGPCPALQAKGDSTSCGLIANPEQYALGLSAVHGKGKMSDAAKILIGAGVGCDARFNGEPPDPTFYQKLRQWDRTNKTDISKAKKLWGV